MQKNQLVCNHKTRFVFHFFSNDLRFFRKQNHLDKPIDAEAVYELNSTLSERLNDISNQIRLLTEAHEHWSILWKKNYIVAETDDFDFNESVQLLQEHGYTNRDYLLEVEYERKWGML